LQGHGGGEEGVVRLRAKQRCEASAAA
jgi:hypothetical protein